MKRQTPRQRQNQHTLNQTLSIAIQHHQQGHLDQAEPLYREILRGVPDQPNATHLLGVISIQRGRPAEAIPLIRKALRSQPNNTDMLCHLASAFMDNSNLDQAEQNFRKALQFQPNLALAHNNLSLVLHRKGQLQASEASGRRAVELDPDIAEAHNNLGIALKDQNKLDEAEHHLKRALELNPNFLEAYNNLADLFRKRGLLQQSVESYQKALEINPNHADTHNNLGVAYLDQGRLELARACYEKSLSIAQDTRMVRNLLNVLLYDASLSPRKLYELYRQHINACRPAEAAALLSAKARAKRPATKRLRVGYLSGDFRNHPVARNILPLLNHHDPEAVELFCYSNAPERDEMTKQIKKAAHHWRSVHEMTDFQTARRIQRDRIQVMVYLAGSFDNNPFLVPIYRPAPVQVSFHNGTTTALDEMDYWMTDSVLHPEEDFVEPFSETLYRLPVFYNYPIPDELPPPSSSPFETNGFITFASLSNPSKINDAVIDLWAEIMRLVPDARLMLKYRNRYADPGLCTQLREAFKHRHVDAHRLQFLTSWDSDQEHIKSYFQADIALDPFPFSGATTTFQALSMGVPVVTLRGRNFIGRMGTDILVHAGFSSWAAQDHPSYVKQAVALAENTNQLRTLRQTLRQRLIESPICDARQYAQNVENGYRRMWESSI
ncbi:MAG: tetratricopeptide repeat protein [Magnetococcales bacterium]|nr:tetratricopeptide repeat protein [Magnetococcales bacterium]